VTAIAFCPFLPAQEKADQVVAPGPSAPAEKTLEWTSEAGQPYWYRIPAQIDAENPPALILMLHGTGSSQGWPFWNYGIARGNFRPNDIVVAPDGVTPGHGSTFNFVQNKNDGDQIEDIITTFKAAYPVSRVYLYGHSQGAFFCYWVAGEHPELIDGIVAHAGNVLLVNHKAAVNENVAVVILHGRADAVVHAECAYRTHRIYQDQGYQKLRLHLVDGLTKQSGHWPLPKQVGESLAWLDMICAPTPSSLLAQLEPLLAEDLPDFELLFAGRQRCAEMLADKQLRDDKGLNECMERIDKLVNHVREAQANALAEKSKSLKSKPVPDAWLGHYRHASRYFSDHPDWDKPLKKMIKLAAKHEKAVNKAISQLSSDAVRNFEDALEVAEKNYLAVSAAELEGRLELIALRAPEGLDRALISRWREIHDAHERLVLRGRERSRGIAQKAIREMRE